VLEVVERGGGILERVRSRFSRVDATVGREREELLSSTARSAGRLRPQRSQSIPITVRSLSSTWFNGSCGISPLAKPTIT
jgi:hypothetical protein